MAWRPLAFFAFLAPPGSAKLALPTDHPLPKVSVIIPAYNEAENIAHCLLSLHAQTYPHRLLEVIVVDDGSDDATVDIVMRYMGNAQPRHRYLQTNSFIVPVRAFGGTLAIIQRERNGDSGKPSAFNAGLAVATGEIIVAVDADVVLAPDAIEQAIAAFLADDVLIAATGHLIIDSRLVVEFDANGDICLDESGLPIPRRLSLSERILTASQFLEYVASFHLGRRSESTVDGMFTISGACAAFRATVFEEARQQYRKRTVTEDADLTMTLHRLKDFRIGYLPTMRVHLTPVLSWTQLYGQRFRWQRGALEVSAIHHLRRRDPQQKWYLWNVMLPLYLRVNHTLIFPRLAWSLVLFLLPLFGYSWGLVWQLVYFLYLLYLVLNTGRTLVAYLMSSIPEKIYIRKYLPYLALYPLYRSFLFWVTLSADIRTLSEKAQWTVESPLLSRLERSARLGGRRLTS
ncbi:MAG: glycosyltransferase family 2 protein [Anaerolineae bacterium]|nr:glycosyltransferase family 2 protein [Anaerolineae bacterium]